jgi:hypothetical protein
VKTAWIPISLTLFVGFFIAAAAIDAMPARGVLGLAAAGSLLLMTLD